MSVSAARKAAFETIGRVRERSAYAHETLDSVLRDKRLDSRDIAFTTRLAYGAIAVRGTLDDAVKRYLKPDVRLEPQVSDALALGAYELLFMRTPAHAAASQTVDLVRSVRPQAAGLANAVMRRLAEDAATFPWGDASSDPVALARAYGHPEWLVRLWISELGWDDTRSILEANNEPAPLYLAYLGRQEAADSAMSALRADGVDIDECSIPRCYKAGDAAFARNAPTVRKSAMTVMDAGAQFAVQAMRPVPGQKLVEIGAGRGGKSLLLAAMTCGSPETVVTAVDLHEFKLQRLLEAAAETGLDCIRVVEADATAPAADFGVAPGTADGVLIDAPCSGLGTLRRHPDRRWRANAEEIDALAVLGGRLLDAAARLVRPGGFMVYSTCTIARRENEGVLEEFLASPQGEGFAACSLLDDVPPEWRRFVTAEGWFRSLPEEGGPDGHFVARLVRA